MAQQSRLKRAKGAVERLQLVEGKRRCDWCERICPPIYECAIRTGRYALWYDLCADCIESQAPVPPDVRREKASLMDAGGEDAPSDPEPPCVTFSKRASVIP